MIREHEFNTQWWGSPVGIVDDDAFFDLGLAEQAEMCASYAWVEYVAPLDSAQSPDRLGSAGFYQVDTQIAFRIGLSGIESTPSIEGLSAVSAEEKPFEVAAGDLMSFVHERFRCLPGMTQEKLNQRYALWSKRLIEEHPAWCLRVLDGTAVQGWFLSEVQEHGPVELTLAMLKSDAHISGLLLYQRAMLEYAARGVRVGGAAFSVTNTPVINIYSTLGARFLPPQGHWFRWPADLGGSSA